MEKEEVNDTLTASQQMTSACVGAMLVSLSMTPLDVVKIRLQAQERVWNKKCFLYSNGLGDYLCPRINNEAEITNFKEICRCRWYNRPKYFTGTVDAFVKIAKTEGITSLWSGLSPTLVHAVPTTVIYFVTYERLRAAMDPNRNDSKIMALSGALARIWSVTIVSPLEMVRTRMQSQRMSFFEAKSSMTSSIKTYGVSGLWRGYTATLYRDVPFSAMYWPCFEACRSRLRLWSRNNGNLKDNISSFRENLISGAFAGSVSSAVTLPFDVIKTHKQIDLGTGTDLKNPPMSNWSVAKEIVESAGVRGLFAGLVPRILKVAPACAIMISSYEYCKNRFRQMNET